MSEPRTSEDLLRVSEEKYRALFEHAPEALVVMDLDRGCFAEVNAEAEKLFKLDRETLLTKNPMELSPPFQPDGRPSDEAAMEVLEEAVRGELPTFEWVHRDGEGNDVLCEVRLLRMPSVGRVLVRGSLTDISRRRELEEQLHHSRKMDAIGKLAGGVAHDFNNLLTVINSYAELARQGLSPNDDVRGYVDEICKAGDKAASLTAQLLALGRKQVIQPRVLDLNLVLEDLLEMLRRLIGENVRLRPELGQNIAPVYLDPGQLEQVVLNLSVNARDAMPQGGDLWIGTRNETLTPRARRAEHALAPGDYVVLSVQDGGVGISPEVQSRIFEPFFTTKEQTGTGLGLATVYAVATQNGGAVTVESVVGEGARFEVWFPASTQAVAAADARPATAAVGRGTVLLVEDEADVRRLLRLSLEGLGYQVLSAANGPEALALAEQNPGPIDALVTDVIMPGMTGVELMESLRSARPGVAVLLISGYADDLIPPSALAQERVDFLPKPFTPQDLGQQLHRLLEARPELA